MASNRRRRLERIEEAGRVREAWFPPEPYARIRGEAREDIARAEAEGEEAPYRVGDDGIIYATSDGRPVRHSENVYAVLDERFRRLDAEISAAGRRSGASRPGPRPTRGRGVGVEPRLPRHKAQRR